MGGVPDDMLLDYVFGLAPGRRLLYVPTATMEDPARTVWWYERLHGRAEMTHLHFFPWPPSGLRGLVLAQDIVLVTGGNTANALAVWRAHGFDEILREAWQRGILLTGWSAGMICWFEHGVTDSFGPELAPMECLGLLPGSACPHYDGEERRRPVYTRPSQKGSRPASLPTTTLPFTTSTPISKRSCPRAGEPPRTASAPTPNGHSRRGCWASPEETSGPASAAAPDTEADGLAPPADAEDER